MTRIYHIAQANIARMRAPQDDPVMAGFVARIDTLNALADASPGFIWRLQDEDGDATSIQAFDDERIVFNVSVWESIEALEAYVYRSDHVAALRKRAEWFERPDKPPLVLWWIEAGHIPTIAEARQRFEMLWRDGPGAQAFTFSCRFDRSG
jgi:hypothetical protein